MSTFYIGNNRLINLTELINVNLEFAHANQALLGISERKPHYNWNKTKPKEESLYLLERKS